MIKRIVDYQESIMDIRSCAHIYRRVLVVVPFNIQTKVVIDSLSVYCCKYPSVALIQQCQDCLINIIVNKNDAFMGTFY